MKPLAARLGSWIWILIYGGLGLLSLGFALQAQRRAWGLAVMAAGTLAVVLGGVLIWVRSRMVDPPDAEPAVPTSTGAPHEHPRP